LEETRHVTTQAQKHHSKHVKSPGSLAKAAVSHTQKEGRLRYLGWPECSSAASSVERLGLVLTKLLSTTVASSKVGRHGAPEATLLNMGHGFSLET
jgi:hypothetical protein